MKNDNECGAILREWRKKRRYSQLQLAVDADVSSKHLSFIETGRTNPSRNMILHLQQFLELPRLELNRALRLAGHAPIYQQLSEQHEDLKPIYQAIDRIIEKQMPYPAFVLDHHWNVVRGNAAMINLLKKVGLLGGNSFVDALVSPDFDRSYISNYYEVINLLAHRIRSENSHNGGDPTLTEIEQKLLTVIQDHPMAPADNGIVLNMKFNIDGQALSVFSTMTELSAVQDVAIGCFKIELMFPLDDVTEGYFAIENQIIDKNK
jgi:transcriptional regulator with XRE-family HTH domain